jgi:hypothetical protein
VDVPVDDGHPPGLLLLHIQDVQEATCWYYAETMPEGARVFDRYNRTCMIEFIAKVQAGGSLCFSAGETGCSGASCYLGFTESSGDSGRFLCEVEGYKKSVELGEAFYESIQAPTPKARHIVWQSCAAITDETDIEVINLWGSADMLSDMVTFANYDRPDNLNVVTPFASGCQSIWTMPCQERDATAPKAVVGCLDPSVRRWLPPGMLSFSLPARRFLEMIDNFRGSFLDKEVFPDTSKS